LVARLPPALLLKRPESPERLAHELLNVATREADILKGPVIERGQSGDLPALPEALGQLLEEVSDPPSSRGARRASQNALIHAKIHENS
jgi:hypothetical protein